MISVAIYHKSVPNGKNPEKVNLLRHFAQGVIKAGDRIIDVLDHSVCPADVAVIQGWITQEQQRPHQQLRHTVIQQQKTQNKRVISADSNLFLYADSANRAHYLRYSFDDVFPGTGNYCDDRPDPERWLQISRDLGIHLKDYRTNGDHILLCLQRHGGWSMGSNDVLGWIAAVILQIRKYSDRPIVIRPHPGDKIARDYIGQFDTTGVLKNVRLSVPGSSLQTDLKNCWAAVNHNSSPVVAAAIEGYPIFVTDPDRSQCREIANVDLADIERPRLPDRQAWIERISMFHWNFHELEHGQCWAHMRKYL